MVFDETNYDESFGYASMVREFMRARLQPPPIPQSLRPQIFAQGDCCWGTRPENSFEMYLMWDYIVQLLPDRLINYVAVSHAGHGINSYGLQFALGYGPLVVIVQNSWGGAYNDHAENACSISRTYNQIKRLLKMIPEDAAERYYHKRIVLIWSEFRDICQYAVQDYRTIDVQLKKIAGVGQFRDRGDYDTEERESIENSLSPDVGNWKQLKNQVELFCAARQALKKLIE